MLWVKGAQTFGGARRARGEWLDPILEIFMELRILAGQTRARRVLNWVLRFFRGNGFS